MSIEARQFLEKSGAFSANLLNEKSEYSGWNSFLRGAVYGRGNGDLLIVVTVKNPSDRFLEFTMPLALTATIKGKPLAQRRFHRIWLDPGQTFAAPLWLNNAGCAGPIDLAAALGKHKRAARLYMLCGE